MNKLAVMMHFLCERLPSLNQQNIHVAIIFDINCNTFGDTLNIHGSNIHTMYSLSDEISRRNDSMTKQNTVLVIW